MSMTLTEFVFLVHMNLRPSLLDDLDFKPYA